MINVFCRFGNSTTGMPDSHTFRLVNGTHQPCAHHQREPVGQAVAPGGRQRRNYPVTDGARSAPTPRNGPEPARLAVP